MIDLKIDSHKTEEILVNFIQETLNQSGFSRIVIGLSGGIDSALSCYLSVKAIGAENVLGIRLPYKTSSRESLDYAQLMIDDLGIPSLTIPITEMVDPLANQFPEMNALRKGNIMARCRMIVLYDQSMAFNGLVVGTGNKTEILLGYTTLYGDSACAFNPIGDLYKAQVWQLSEHMGVPEEIISRAPSADLWDGQTDEDELGFTYKQADELLYLMVDERKTPKQCMTLGYEEPLVNAVVKRVKTSGFKRNPVPVCFLSEHHAYNLPNYLR